MNNWSINEEQVYRKSEEEKNRNFTLFKLEAKDKNCNLLHTAAGSVPLLPSPRFNYLSRLFLRDVSK